MDYPPEVRHRFNGSPQQLADGVVREPPRGWREVEIADYDPAWPTRFDDLAATLHAELGPLVEDLQHVGSTSVPGLAAKPIIDIDLLIADTDEEQRYLPALEDIGYVLILREPWWHGHRMLVDQNEDVHLHVWPTTAPEPVRHRLFRDWLRDHPEDRRRYESAKRHLAQQKPKADYTLAKNEVIDRIYERIFAS